MPRRVRPIRVCGDVAYVPLSQGYEAIIDAADVPLVDNRYWSALCRYRADGSLRTVYAVSTIRRDGKYTTVRLHREIMHPHEGIEIDHINSDGLDNRRSNLRISTHQQNSQNLRKYCNNKSGFKGVSWHNRDKKWQSSIMAHGKNKHLGNFDTPEEAHSAYCKASAKYHGEFGRTE